MKKLMMLFAAMTAMAACGTRETPFLQSWDTPYGLPPFGEIRYEDYLPALTQGIAEMQAEIAAIAGNPEKPDFENTLAAFDRSGALLAKVEGVLFNLSSSDSSKEFEAILEKAAPMLAALDDDIFLNAALYDRVKAVYEADQSGLTREQQLWLKKLWQRFTLSGIGLPEERQARLREINAELASAGQRFANNLLAEENAFAQEFGLPVSAYEEEMTFEKDRARRERLFRARTSLGNTGNAFDNKAVCLRILQLRAEKAELLGYADYAEYALQDKMAARPEAVDRFLSEIMAGAVAKAAEETAGLQRQMDRDIESGIVEKGSVIQPWDWFYYAEKVRKEKYALDEELTKPYFVLENVRDGAFRAAEKLYGIRIEPLSGVPVYQKGVEAFKVSDADSSLLGIFYTDYLPRPGKRGGAWMNNFRDQYVDAAGRDVRPVIVNVASMNAPSGATPSLLTVDQVQTVFHEFGHALHGLLSRCHYRGVSGTAVAQDFVETFSQFNENWAFQPEILSLYAKDYRSGEVIPDSLVAGINASLRFNQGFRTAELCAASILDMRWHELSRKELEDIDIPGFEEKVRREMGLPDEIVPRYATTYFSHIFHSGYSAGYYGYLWSEVLERDAFEYFEAQGLFNPAVSAKFRRTFLERGGSEEPMTLYQEFRGKAPDTGALLRGRGLQ